MFGETQKILKNMSLDIFKKLNTQNIIMII